MKLMNSDEINSVAGGSRLRMRDDSMNCTFDSYESDIASVFGGAASSTATTVACTALGSLAGLAGGLTAGGLCLLSPAPRPIGLYTSHSASSRSAFIVSAATRTS
jgi:hypothetical protein